MTWCQWWNRGVTSHFSIGRRWSGRSNEPRPNEQAADEEVEEVFTPLQPKDRLVAGDQEALNRNEDDAREQDAQDEPIEVEIDVGLDVDPLLGLRPSPRRSRSAPA